MTSKSLLEIDLRIALLRERAARGQGDDETVIELRELQKKRGELIEKIVADCHRERK